MSNFLTRTITGTLFVIVLIGSILWNKYSFTLLFLLITLFGTWEFYKLSERGDNKPQKITGTILAGILFLSNASIPLGICNFSILIINIPLLFLIFIVELYLKANNPFRNIAFTILGIVYVALPFSLLNHMVYQNNAYDPQLLLGFLFIIWANDTGAYIFGSWLGKRKLFERISPKKSWEGSIGGALCSFIVAGVIANYFTGITMIDWLVVAGILVVTGTLGDLIESLYKRSKNAKDSGTILPGHGGILDRFDSLLLSSPFVFTYLLLIN